MIFSMALRFWSAAVGLALVAALLLVVCPARAGDPPQSASGPRLDPVGLLANMPMNSDHRCMGICLVVAALLDGERIHEAGCDAAEELAREIYAAAKINGTIRYHAELCWSDQRQPINSREALAKLSTLVADLFKDQWRDLFATERGRQKLLAAQRVFLQTPQALDDVLAADKDQTDAFLLIGNRFFPDGMRKDTAHVVLIKRTPTEILVYDPNDPAAAQRPRFEVTPQGLTIEWSCKYRDTGQVTRQIYLIGQKATFFEMIEAK